MEQDDLANSRYARLRISGPDGHRQVVELRGQRLTIGRLPDCNDIALEPDPEHLVSRQSHCALDYTRGCWGLEDVSSANGTFLFRGGTMQAVRARVTLTAGDVIRILAGHHKGRAVHWELAFEDPHRTRIANARAPEWAVSFDLAQQELFVLTESGPEKIKLSPQERALVRHLAVQNRQNGDTPTLCSYRELMSAVWDEDGHAVYDLSSLVIAVRRKVQAAVGDDFNPIENVPRHGYRFHPSREAAPLASWRA